MLTARDAVTIASPPHFQLADEPIKQDQGCEGPHEQNNKGQQAVSAWLIGITNT